jgi:4,4'-diaponeurosporenoate glycosyltransferase
MELLAIFRSLFLFSALAYWPAGLLLFSRLEKLDSPEPQKSNKGRAEFPGVSIIIPVRNEAAAIGPLIRALALSDPPPEEIIVVDDRSEDGTADLVREAALPLVRLIESDGPSGDWTGKNRACHIGACAASAEFLLFLDADVIPCRDLPLLLYRRWLDNGGGLVSVQPFHRMKKAYEKLSLFFNLVALAGSRDFGIFRGKRDPAGAFGPCLFTSASLYRKAGGHEAIAASVVDDIAMVKNYRRKGFPVRSFTGAGALSFRMYPQGIRQLSEGWTKNMASGAGHAGAAVLILLILWITGMINAFLLVLASPGFLSFALFIAWAGQIFFIARKAGSFGPLSALLYPLHLLFFVFILFKSMIATHFRGSVTWRGRSIRVGRIR